MCITIKNVHLHDSWLTIFCFNATIAMPVSLKIVQMHTSGGGHLCEITNETMKEKEEFDEKNLNASVPRGRKLQAA